MNLNSVGPCQRVSDVAAEASANAGRPGVRVGGRLSAESEVGSAEWLPSDCALVFRLTRYWTVVSRSSGRRLSFVSRCGNRMR